MNEKKPISLLTVILNCICALLWTINCMVRLGEGSVRTLDVFCAIVWGFCAAIWVIRYWNYKKKEDLNDHN